VVNFHVEDHCNTLVREMFSTITSPVFSELVIVLGGDLKDHLPPGILLGEELRELNKIRPFKLVFLFGGHHWGIGDPRGTLASSVASETRTGGYLGFLGSPPTVRISQSRSNGWGLLDDD